MNLNLLDVFFIVSGVILFIFAYDIAKKQKFNALHFIVFLLIWLSLIWFTVFPWFLNYIGHIFGLQRWADLLVYISIIFLFYFVILLLNKVEKHSKELTEFIRSVAIFNSSKKYISWKYAFVIPAYNEWKVIYNTVNNLVKWWYKNIIVVNDWSSDNTSLELDKFNDNVITITHFKNRWQWAALETGFEYIRRYWNVEYIVTYDSDWQHQIEDLKVFEEYIENNKNSKIFLWSRFKWKVENIRFARKIILKLAIVFTFFISNIKLSDTHNGYRVLKKEVLNDIKITIDGMWHASELLDIVASKKIPYTEVPVNIIYSEYSMSKWQKTSNAINIALKMIWMKFFR